MNSLWEQYQTDEQHRVNNRWSNEQCHVTMKSATARVSGSERKKKNSGSDYHDR
jgi:hypothetical protein